MDTFLDIVESVREFIVMAYLIPFDMWDMASRYDDGIMYFGAIFMGIVFYGLTLIGAIAAIYGLYRWARWLKLRERCQHCGDWTIGPAGAMYTGCLSTQPCCYDCALGHKAKAENIHDCPIDSTPMEKVITDIGDIIDMCPSCRVILLSEDELENIKEQARAEGRSSGTATGVALGIAISP
jgi:hypothetical protein